MAVVDLEPAAGRLADLVRGVAPGALHDPTPCARYCVADLLDHIASLAQGFTDAARKVAAPGEDPPPPGDGSRLGAGWRETIPQQLDALVRAWSESGAQSGTTSAGGIELPGEVAAAVALEELVVHGWDLATATGQPYAVDDDSLHAVIGVVSQFAGDDQAEVPGAAYRAPVPVGAGAPLLDRAIALTGRDPGWRPPGPPRGDLRGFVRALVLPRGFVAPRELRSDDLTARALSRDDLAADVAGINASIDLIQRTRGGGWPTEEVSEDFDFVDLVWHEQELRENQSFSYAVYGADGGYVGCCYLYPMGRRTPLAEDLLRHDVDVSWWVTPAAYERGDYEALYRALRRWVVDSFPFKDPWFSNREIPQQ
jgi:uncharacterized protein (TIGR03086 family)